MSGSRSTRPGPARGPGRPIRVTLVGPSLDILGGQAVQCRRLLERLATLPDLRVSFLPVNPRLPGPLRVLQRVKYLRTVVTSIVYTGSLLARLPRTDVVHAFSAGYWSFLLAPLPAMVAGRLYRRRVVLNYRTGEAADHLRRHRRLAAQLARLAHTIVVPSGFLVEVFARHGLRARAVPNFVDPTRLPFRERAPQPRFLSNRNFEPMYNVACVLRAFARIQAERAEASLVLVGQGTERKRLEALARSLGLRQVTFAGAAPPEEMPGYYQAADIYLNAPDIDNMPTSVIEAFAAGLPVVSTDAGGIPWLVRHEENGLLVARNDDLALARSALRLLSEPGLAARLARAARRDVEARYTWEATAPAWLGVYRDLMARDGSAP